MISTNNTGQSLTEFDRERASYAYIISMVVGMVAIPLPVTGLIATIIYCFANRNKGDFIKWHCTQPLIARVPLVLLNSGAVWWTIYPVSTPKMHDGYYLAYTAIVVIANLIEVIASIYTAIAIRKGIHIRRCIWSEPADEICRK